MPLLPNLRAIRQARELRPGDFIELVGVSRGHIVNLEACRRSAGPELTHKIARLLNVTVAELTEPHGVPDPPPPQPERPVGPPPRRDPAGRPPRGRAA